MQQVLICGEIDSCSKDDDRVWNKAEKTIKNQIKFVKRPRDQQTDTSSRKSLSFLVDK